MKLKESSEIGGPDGVGIMNCKPGDMAVVVCGNNIGLIVEIVGVSETYGWPHWRVHSAWPARGINPDGTVVWTAVGSIHDARLRPIRPDEAPRCREVPVELETMTD